MLSSAFPYLSSTPQFPTLLPRTLSSMLLLSQMSYDSYINILHKLCQVPHRLSVVVSIPHDQSRRPFLFSFCNAAREACSSNFASSFFFIPSPSTQSHILPLSLTTSFLNSEFLKDCSLDFGSKAGTEPHPLMPSLLPQCAFLNLTPSISTPTTLLCYPT